MRLLFKGGTVVTGKGPRRADVLVEDEKILDVCRDIPAIGAQVVDVTGMLLFPGFIDAHTHFDLDVCNTTAADDLPAAPGRRCGAAPPPSSTLPAPTRARRCTTACGSGTRRPTVSVPATTAST